MKKLSAKNDSMILVLAAVLSMSACEEQERKTCAFHLSFSVVDDRGEPLAEIPVDVGATRIGATDPAGSLRADVQANDGDRFPLRAPCPENYEASEMPEEVIFLERRGLDGIKDATIETRIVCKRQTQIAAILVHVGGLEGLPILVDGARRGETGPGGFAHLRFEGPPDTPFELSVDTSADPSLVPQNPRQEMQLGSEDGLFIFEPDVSERKPQESQLPRRKRRRVRRGQTEEARRPKRPIKID